MLTSCQGKKRPQGPFLRGQSTERFGGRTTQRRRDWGGSRTRRTGGRAQWGDWDSVWNVGVEDVGEGRDLAADWEPWGATESGVVVFLPKGVSGLGGASISQFLIEVEIRILSVTIFQLNKKKKN